MREVIFSLLTLFLLSFMPATAQKMKPRYIAFDFAYEHRDLPVPTLIFNVDSFPTDPILFTGYKFHINEADFLEIEKIVKENSAYIILNEGAERYYDFKFVGGDNPVTYGTVNLNTSKVVFKKIVSYFEKSESYINILRAFQELDTILWPRRN